MRPGWNPVRRNKKIGTKAQGHGSNNKMVVPESWHSFQCFWEKLSSYVLVKRNIGEKEQLFFVEPALPGWFYPCAIDDIALVLNRLPAKDVGSFDFLILRQPTRKQRILSPVWGRAQFSIDIDGYSGSGIIIEAQALGDYHWEKSLTVEQAKELERLKVDGHTIAIGRKFITISPSVESIRNTVLFRTLLHEIGHHVDYGKTEPGKWGEKTKREKEDFAHRYADEQRSALLVKGLIPFTPVSDKTSIESDGLKTEWFA